MGSITKYRTYESIHCFLFVISELVFQCRKNPLRIQIQIINKKNIILFPDIVIGQIRSKYPPFDESMTT